ncbi:hypothetical protein GCM10011497_23250 [Elstera cyanobacteriorum]|nr:hypothetical protein GCM10011497_23250 [Elstera cyanobacteriorum]
MLGACRAWKSFSPWREAAREASRSLDESEGVRVGALGTGLGRAYPPDDPVLPEKDGVRDELLPERE